MNNSIRLRIGIDILLSISVLNGWWFVALPLAILGIWLYPFFIESIIAGSIFDALFGFVPGIGFWRYMGTVGSVCVFCLGMFIKKKVR
jgi:hypothetical protein